MKLNASYLSTISMLGFQNRLHSSCQHIHRDEGAYLVGS